MNGAMFAIHKWSKDVGMDRLREALKEALARAESLAQELDERERLEALAARLPDLQAELDRLTRENTILRSRREADINEKAKLRERLRLYES